MAKINNSFKLKNKKEKKNKKNNKKNLIKSLLPRKEFRKRIICFSANSIKEIRQ